MLFHAIRGFVVFLLISAALSGSARAQYLTPENGVWWNPAESGSGMQIEFQDAIVSVTWYGYSPSGQSIFYVLAGVFDVIAGRFNGDVVAFANGQCIGCPYNPPVATLAGRGGISFQTRSRGILTLPRPGGGSRDTLIERFSFGYGSSLERQNVGLWTTTIVYNTGLPEGDVVAIQRTEVDSAGPYVVGRLYPANQLIIGEAATLPGTSFNFTWLISFSQTSDAFYGAEFTLNGFRGFYSIIPRGASLPGSGILAFGTRLAGPNTANQIIASGLGASVADLDDASKRRINGMFASAGKGSETVLSKADQFELQQSLDRLRLRRDRELVRQASLEHP